VFEREYLGVMRAKLGLSRAEENDGALVEGLLSQLAVQGGDYTLFFRRLATAVDASGEAGVLSLFAGNEAPLRGWLDVWRRRLALESEGAARSTSLMQQANPALIPRNHRVEEAIQAAANHGDFQPFETLVLALTTPYAERPEHAHLAEPPKLEERVTQTFCGT